MPTEPEAADAMKAHEIRLRCVCCYTGLTQWLQHQSKELMDRSSCEGRLGICSRFVASALDDCASPLAAATARKKERARCMALDRGRNGSVTWSMLSACTSMLQQELVALVAGSSLPSRTYLSVPLRQNPLRTQDTGLNETDLGFRLVLLPWADIHCTTPAR